MQVLHNSPHPQPAAASDMNSFPEVSYWTKSNKNPIKRLVFDWIQQSNKNQTFYLYFALSSILEPINKIKLS